MPVCCGPDIEAGSLSNIEKVGQVTSPVISRLLQQADDYIIQQQWAKAASVLERALRINNRQSEVWSRLALVVLKQGRLPQAIEMAKRSNSYARQNKALQVANWSLIAKAYTQLNNAQQAQIAANKAQQLKEARD